jgi:mRNA deadenylase 3'-5' endonuclease subunit Ccr4
MIILTWNILASEWIKKSYYPGIKESVLFDYNARFSKICKKIQTINPDIILLQEVMPREYDKLVSMLKDEYFISELKTITWQYNKNSKSGNVTFLRRSIFSYNYIINIPLEYGIYTQCVCNKLNFDIFNIHLDDQSSRERYKQCDEIHSIARKRNCINIIGGDFNHQYKSNSRMYKVPGFTTHNVCPSYYIERKMNIDNILTRGLKKITGGTCPLYPTNIEDGFKDYGSDHLPIITNVST